jgi:hypothetical protein
LFDGCGGRTVATATLLLAMLASWAAPPARDGLLILLVITTTAIATTLVEETLHAVACHQQAGQHSLLGIVTRSQVVLGVPLPRFIGVVCAASLTPLQRAKIAAAGPLGATALMTLPASVLASLTGSPWVLGLLLLPALSLVPFRTLTAAGTPTDGDIILAEMERLELGWAGAAALCWAAAADALFAPLGPGALQAAASETGSRPQEPS